MNRICHIEIDEKGLARPTPEIEQERRVAIYRPCWRRTASPSPRRADRVTVPEGPYRVLLAIREGRLVFEVATEAMPRRSPSSTCRWARSGRW
jgi:uncharacterized protein (UPF0262 family)